MDICRRVVAAVAAVWLVMAIPTAQAQSIPGLPGFPDPAPAPAPAPETQPPAPKVRTSSQIATDLEQARDTVQRIREGSVTPPEVTSLKDGLEARQADIERREGATRTLLETASAPQRLQDELASWRRTHERLQVDDTALRDWIARLDTHASTLQTLEETWRDVSLPPTTPPSLRAEVLGLRGDMVSVGEAVDEQRASALALELTIKQMLEKVQALESALTTGMHRRLVTRDSPPLWRAPMRSHADAPVMQRLATSTTERRQALAGFVDASPGLIGLHVALTLLLLLGAFRVRRLPESARPADPSFPARALLDHPFSSALQVSLTLGFLLYGDAPSSLIALLVLLVSVPLVRLLRRVASPRVALVTTVLLALYILFRALTALAGGEALFRLALALVGVAAVALGLWAYRVIAPDDRPLGEGGSGPLRPVVRGATALLVLSVLANVIGMVTLAIFLVDATLESVLFAVLVFLTETILEGALEVSLKLPIAQNLTVVQRHAEVIARRGRRWLRVGALLVWVVGALDVFSLLDPIVAGLGAVLGASANVGNLEFSLGSILAFVLGLVLSVYLSRTLQTVLEEDVLPRMELPAGVPGTISKTAQYVVLTLGFLLALSAAGVHLSSFAFLAGALGVGIGFGLQTIVNNFVSGLILLFERPIKEGDVIEVGTLLGTVEHIGIRACRVRTLQGAEVIVPNANLVSNDVVNWTLTDRLRRMELPVGVKYGTDPKQVLELLVKCCKDHPDVRDRPAPDALFNGFGESSLDFVLRGWVPFEDFFRVRSEIAVAVNQALKDAAIEIPFPQRDLHLRSVEDDLIAAYQRVPPDQEGG